MEGRYRPNEANHFSDEEFQAGSLRSHNSHRLPPNLRELVVSSLKSMSSHETTILNLVLCGREEPLKASAAKAFIERKLSSNTSGLENIYLPQFPGLFGKSEPMGSSSSQSEDELRMVLIGKTGSGKSTTANIILGRNAFTPKALPKRANTTCEKETGEIDGRTVTVVNTPDLYNTTLSDEEIQEELSKCFEMLAPGPHVFLLVLQIGSISQDEKDSVELIKRVFGHKSKDFIIIIFTRGGDLDGQSIEDYMEGCDGFLKKLVNDCGGRYQVFTKNDDTNLQQAKELLTKIQSMVRKNGGGCYNAEMVQFTKETVQREVTRANKRLQEEMKEMKKKLEALEREKQQNQGLKKQQEEVEEMKKKVEALEREKQRSQRAKRQQEEILEVEKKLETLEREKQLNQRDKKYEEEIEELKKKLEKLEKDRQQRAKKQHQEEVEKLRQEIRDMKTQIDGTKDKGCCNIM